MLQGIHLEHYQGMFRLAQGKSTLSICRERTLYKTRIPLRIENRALASTTGQNMYQMSGVDCCLRPGSWLANVT